MGIKERVKSNASLKKFVHALLVTSHYRPRWWLRNFVNPFVHKRGRGAKIRWKARLDLLPYNHFEIGKESIVEDFCTINNMVGGVTIGDRSLIGLNCVLIGPVTIGNDVLLAQNIVVSGLNHGYEDVTKSIRAQEVTTSEIKINDGAWIAANVSLTAGVTIGENSIVGAGSVVTKDVSDYTIVVGNPAKPIKQYNFDTQKWEKI